MIAENPHVYVRTQLNNLINALNGDDRTAAKAAITELLALDDFTPVYEAADRVRKKHVGDIVHLRAIIEFSNICRRQCRYCGLNRENHDLRRFRMSREEIVETARRAVNAGYRTIVLQSGEDEFFTPERLGAIVEEIKGMHIPENADGNSEYCQITQSAESTESYRMCGEIAVTVSCGEMSRSDYAYLRSKGADRYLLKHETADPALYSRLHPCGSLENRTNCLKTIHELGYETGSGFMIGLPGQTLETIAEDLLMLKAIPCRMAGIGPFISNPKTELAGEKNGDPELARRAVAIARLLLPEANLPVTTALSILTEEEKTGAHRSGADSGQEKIRQKKIRQDNPGQDNPFAFGANVVMKKVTPDEYKQAYEIYPAKFKKTDIAGDRQELERLIRACGRVPL